MRVSEKFRHPDAETYQRAVAETPKMFGELRSNENATVVACPGNLVTNTLRPVFIGCERAQRGS
jgi:hypothetical protein